MTYRPVLALAALLALAACSSDDTSSDDGATSVTAAATDPPDTSDGDGSTTPASAPATSAPSEQAAQAERIAGTYTGEWVNTTFGSTGTMDASVVVDADAATATLTLDIGGTAFGSPDPPEVVTVIPLGDAGPIAGTNDFFGDFTVTVDQAGHLVFEAPSVPGVGGRKMTVDGTFADGTFTGTYAIAGLADGTFTCTRA